MALYEFLEANDIEFLRVDHEPVFTCEEADRLVPPLPGIDTKNLFLRDKKGRRHFLVVVPSQKAVNLRALSKVLEAPSLGFASPKRLADHLGVEPGSVTLLSVINDAASAVEVVIDQAIWDAERIKCHPLVNTSTLSISRSDIERFLSLSGHEVRVLEVPSGLPGTR